MSQRLDLCGETIGRLTVIERGPELVEFKSNRSTWICRCACGQTTQVRTKHLRGGQTTSCGCFRREHQSKQAHRHGLWKTKAYSSWHCMMKRCYDPKDISYPNYGGRGIRVIDRWHDVRNFVADMGEPPAGHSIDRKDGNKGYEPDNCRWAPKLKQNNNRRGVQQIECDGQTKTIREWSDVSGVKHATIDARLRKGWSAKDAIFTAVH